MIFFSGSVWAEGQHSRYYLGIGETTPDVWQDLIDNPTDQEETMGAAPSAMGGEIISYFWVLADGKNYITIRLPDDPEIVQTRYLSRLSQGVLKSYTFTELMTSADMVDALKRIPDFMTPVE
ncbi:MULTISPECIES: hypothetical protein [unclassified Ruegeria]|uniref:hypothetical protein n=1 Tax=unclassified Ruegeria TaxID=2625375 RepID=UPI00148927F5|nr:MULTISPECIES: hypothetical protein [unclassified Ruegeria]